MILWKGPLALAGVIGLAACADRMPTAPDDPFTRPAPTEHRGLNAEFTRLAQEIPGFGGMYYDENGKLNVYVAGDRMTPAALKRALANTTRDEFAVLARMSGGSDDIVVQAGAYDFAQLSRWHSLMRPVLGMDGVVFTDIDESRNRLRIGVEAGVAAAQVEAAVQQYNVPAEAVSIELTEPVVALTNATLQDRVQPFGGGLQLVFPNPMPGFVSLCTLGFNILPNAPGQSVAYFLMNSHCTLNRGTLDNTPYYQQPVAFLDPRQLIAFEVVDLPFFTDPLFCPYAPFGYVCRYSDAAIARYITPRTPVRFGSIYRTASVGSGGAAGSREITGSNPDFFDIVGEEPFPLLGEELDKVGRTTGWTRGPVVGTCVDIGVFGTNIAMLCQDLVQAALAGGDSGSPVFRQLGDTRYARLYGILWGGGGTFYVFSAMENIHFELGDFRTH